MEEKEYILTLENNKEYALIKTIAYDGNSYVFLIDLDDCETYVVGKVEENNIEIVKDNDLLNILLAHFSGLED